MIHFGEFEGIGGFSIAAKQMGWETLITSEINPFCRTVLKYWFPNAYHHGDIKTLTYDTINAELSKRHGPGWRNDKIILTGGFPCQPFSVAGKRKGTEDDRNLWPEMYRTIREIHPDWVVAENVIGLISWNRGLVFEQVYADLENEGYEVQPVTLPACSVNAPHKRERVWFIAHNSNARLKGLQQRRENGVHEFGITSHSNSSRWKNRQLDRQQIQGIDNEGRNTSIYNSEIEKCITSDSYSKRQSREEYREKISGFFTEESVSNYWQNFPTQSPFCSGDDGFPGELVGITFSKWRNESIKALGNAIVPQVACEIFKAIDTYERSSVN